LLIALGPRDFDIGAGNSVDVWETTSASYLCVTFYALITHWYPPNMRWIQERSRRAKRESGNGLRNSFLTS
jgi:hypothetical protein